MTIEIDILGLAVPAPPKGMAVLPEYEELQRLLADPIAAAVTAALAV